MVRAALRCARAAIAASRECRDHERRARKRRLGQAANQRGRSLRETPAAQRRTRSSTRCRRRPFGRFWCAAGSARGFRLSSELVAGVLVGAGIGWLIDRSLGVSPWGLIVFLLLGFAAGVLNVMRSAGIAPQ